MPRLQKYFYSNPFSQSLRKAFVITIVIELTNIKADVLKSELGLAKVKISETKFFSWKNFRKCQRKLMLFVYNTLLALD